MPYVLVQQVSAIDAKAAWQEAHPNFLITGGAPLAKPANRVAAWAQAFELRVSVLVHHPRAKVRRWIRKRGANAIKHGSIGGNSSPNMRTEANDRLSVSK